MTINDAIKSIRIDTFGTTKFDTTVTEQFQNMVLRPILKFQNDLFLLLFKQYISNYVKDFGNMKLEQKIEFVQNIFQKDMKFRNLNTGIVLGLFIDDELNVYFENKSEYNKRIISMLSERIVSQLQML